MHQRKLAAFAALLFLVPAGLGAALPNEAVPGTTDGSDCSLRPFTLPDARFAVADALAEAVTARATLLGLSNAGQAAALPALHAAAAAADEAARVVALALADPDGTVAPHIAAASAALDAAQARVAEGGAAAKAEAARHIAVAERELAAAAAGIDAAIIAAIADLRERLEAAHALLERAAADPSMVVAAVSSDAQARIAEADRAASALQAQVAADLAAAAETAGAELLLRLAQAGEAVADAEAKAAQGAAEAAAALAAAQGFATDAVGTIQVTIDTSLAQAEAAAMDALAAALAPTSDPEGTLAAAIAAAATAIQDAQDASSATLAAAAADAAAALATAEAQATGAVAESLRAADAAVAAVQALVDETAAAGAASVAAQLDAAQAALAAASAAALDVASNPERVVAERLADAQTALAFAASQATQLAGETEVGVLNAIAEAQVAVAQARATGAGAIGSSTVPLHAAIQEAQSHIAAAEAALVTGSDAGAGAGSAGADGLQNGLGTAAVNLETESRFMMRDALLSGPVIVWTNLNMGAGSCLDADTLDGFQAQHFFAAIDDVAAQLAAAVQSLTDALAGEAALRADGDDRLAALLTAEAATRASEVTRLEGALAEAVATLNGALASEAAARAAADQALRAALDDETAARVARDLSLTDAIAAEQAARIAADDALRARIGDTAGGIRADLDDEIAARIAGDNAEASLRSNADAAEANARANADSALQNGLNNEAAVRASADNTLQNNLNSEAAARAAGDASRYTKSEADSRFALSTHLHDDRYFTEAESDARYIRVGQPVGNADTVDGLHGHQFLRRDVSDSMNGHLSVAGSVGAGSYLWTNDAVYANNWLRTNGPTGWYAQSYCGGWWMAEPTWIRSYCGKSVYVDNELQSSYVRANQWLSATRTYLGQANQYINIGSNLGGCFVAFNDDACFYDPQNGWIYMLHPSQASWGYLYVGYLATVYGKSFVQEHPTKPDTKLYYYSLESPTSDIYWRGSGTLVQGKAVVTLPENFAVLASGELTVSVTPRGATKGLYVPDGLLNANGFTVMENAGGLSSAKFDYVVYATRLHFEDAVQAETFTMEDKVLMSRGIADADRSVLSKLIGNVDEGAVPLATRQAFIQAVHVGDVQLAKTLVATMPLVPDTSTPLATANDIVTGPLEDTFQQG